MLSVMYAVSFMLSVIYAVAYAECSYAECYYVECRGAAKQANTNKFFQASQVRVGGYAWKNFIVTNTLA